MGFTSGEIRGFVDAVRSEPESGECVTRGTVTRVDANGTAWVQIGQNAEPTPCGMDVSARVGDIVTVRIADHRATVTGNSTSPATDDRAAMEAHGVATAAKASAEAAQDEAHGAQQAAASAATTARVAETAAQEAKQAARSVNQHFWDDTRGAHVTEAEKDAYVEEPSGFQNLMTSIGNIFTKAVDGVERILRSDTASGMVVYDGECAPDARDLASHAIASFTSDGATIGRESSTHTSVTTNSMSIMYGTDRLVSVTSDGTTASVYMGASTAAPGCKYTNAKVVAYKDMLNSGYRIVPEPDASGRCAILDPDGHTSEFFAVKDTSPYSTLYSVKDPDGDELYSGMYSGIFSEEGHEDHFYLNHKLNPAAEVPGPVDIEGGNVSFHAEDGAATVTGSIAVTNGITTQGNVADATGTLDAVRQAAQPSTIVNLVYPVGSIYMSTSQAEPSTLFGGTWQRLKDCMLMAAGDTYAAGDTGGAAAHTLTAQEMPNHKHTVPAHGHGMTQATYTLPDHVHSASTDVKGNHRHVQRIGTSTFVVGSNNQVYTDGVKESGRYVTQDAVATTYRNVTAWAGDHSHSVNVGNPTTHPSCTRTQNAAVSDKPSFDTQATGGGQAFSTLPPYMTVNVWKRTA